MNLPSRHSRFRGLLPQLTVALILGLLLGRMSAEWYPSLIASVLAAGGVALLRGKARRVALLVLTLSLGGLRGWLAWHPALPETGTHTVSGVVSDEIQAGTRTQLRTILRDVTVDGQPVLSGAYWTFYPPEGAVPEGLEPGKRVTVTARIYEPEEADNPGGFNFREYLLQQGIDFGVYGYTDLVITDAPYSLYGIAASARHSLSEGLIRVMGEEAGGYAAAMMLGSRKLVNDDDRTAFNRLGIGHLLTVSGFHVGILAIMLGFILKRLKVARRWRLAAEALILAAYSLLTGLHAPVIRAALLAVLAEYGALRNRQRDGLNLLCCSAALTLIVCPAMLTGASFQLSYAALLGLILVTPWLTKLRSWTHPAAKWLWQAFCAAIGVQVGILLPILYWYQELPLLSIPLNLFVLALSSVVLVFYWIVMALMWIPGIGAALGTAAAWLTDGLVGGVRALGSQDWLTLWTAQANWVTAIGCAVLFAALCDRLPLRRKPRAIAAAAGVLITALSVIPVPFHGTEYIQLSVGSADAAVLWDQSTVTVIDAGETQTLAEYLHQRRLSIDTLFITHLHTDHAGGIAALIDQRIPVRVCVLPSGAEDMDIDEGMAELIDRLRATGAEIVYAGRGDVFDLPDGRLTVTWPETGKTRAGSDANSFSLTMLAELRGSTMLLTGDLDGSYEMYAVQGADILKVPHHGSARSSSAAFLEAVSAQAAILPCGDESRETSFLSRAGDMPVWSTRTAGAVTVTFTEAGFMISGYKGGALTHGEE